MEKKNNYKFILYVGNLLFLLCLFILDNKFMINHLFAAIFFSFIFFLFKEESLKKHIYLAVILTSIMGAALKVPLGDNKILSQLNVYYIYIFIYYIVLFIDIYNKRVKVRVTSFTRKPIILLGLAFIIYVYISIFWAGNKVMAIKELVSYTAIFALSVIVIIENLTAKDRRITYKILFYVSLGILVYSTIKIVTGMAIEPRTMYTDYEYFSDPAYMYTKRIPVVFYYNPNDYALVLSIILANLFVSIVRNKNSNRKAILLFVMFIVGQINLIFTSSRTAWIGIIISCVITSVLYIVRRKMNLLKRSGMLIACIGIVFVVLYNCPFTEIYFGKIKKVDVEQSLSNKENYIVTINESLSSKNINEEEQKSHFSGIVGGQSSDRTRLNLIINSFNYVFKEGNFLGAGVGNINVYNEEMNNTGSTHDPHNLWAEILGDFGVPGFILFIAIYIYCFIKSMKMKDGVLSDRNVISIVAMAMLVFGPSSVVPIAPFWMFLSLIISTTLDKSLLNVN
ncbi:O-antigen ligase family protein [Clostridium paraputrificum]|uniref:O-antigen ligase family protein n=1 Tax=Clostridium TaxID=1485 RepID=UPI003D33F192